MKASVLVPALAIVFASHAAPAASAPDLALAPFPAQITDVDPGSSDVVSGCALATTGAGIRLRFNAAEPSVERMSLDGVMPNVKVTARVKVPLTKIAENDGALVYAYREANAIVLIVPGKELFATMTHSADRVFIEQTCGIGIALLFTKPLDANDVILGGRRFPGFSGRMARLEGTSPSFNIVTVTAGLGPRDEISVLIKSRPKPAAP
jgi:hypothetical protein